MGRELGRDGVGQALLDLGLRRFLVEPRTSKGLRNAGRGRGADVGLDKHLLQLVEIILVQTLFRQYAGDLVRKTGR